VLDVEPDVRSAIAQELVIPLRSLVELVGALDVIVKLGVTQQVFPNASTSQIRGAK
jgi:hypothetical protein